MNRPFSFWCLCVFAAAFNGGGPPAHAAALLFGASEVAARAQPSGLPVLQRGHASCRDSVPPARYANGVVVSAHPEASKVGLGILQAGGNAIDAAIAVQFALAVVYPNAGNIGGGGFMLVREATGEFASLDFRETAPRRAHRDMYLDQQGQVIKGLSLTGHLAAGVPGTVAGMAAAYRRYRKLPWKALLEPAIGLARKGFALTPAQAAQLNGYREIFREQNPGSDYLLKEEWKAGDTLVQEDLARTLERIRDRGAAGFYRGKTARLIVREMKKGGGIMRRGDLKAYRALWRKPLSGTYKHYRVVSMPPPSSGGLALLQLLGMVEHFPLGELGHQSPQAVHLMAEAERRVYADRARYLGDPDFYNVPVNELLDEAYLRERMASFDPAKASLSSEVEAGELGGPFPHDRRRPLPPESPETTHFSIADREGNAVALTTTLNGNFGAKIFVGGAGFLLNNEMDDFSAKPGEPNMFGLVGGEANAIAPGKRMLSSMTPTILEKNGKLFMVLGSPGGSTIITTVFQTILNVIEHGMDVQEAVNAGRFHHQWLPDHILFERGALGEDLRQALKALSHQLETSGSIGRCDAILAEDGVYYGAPDPRGDDTALGY